jgi:hypothetical protein
MPQARLGDYPECLYCGVSFYRSKERKRQGMTCCCVEHWSLYARNRRKDRAICKGCGKEFWYDKNKKQTYCSIACRKSDKNVEMLCDFCEKVYTTNKNELKYSSRHFCSRECHRNGSRGELNPRWSGGPEASYQRSLDGITNLSDNYVKASLTARSGLGFKDIPQSLIDAKRLHLQMLRFNKEQENEQKETKEHD